MGRKIPGRKHRGIRDLEKQRQYRLEKLQDKVNAPPIDINEQEIPKSLARIMELKEKVKTGAILQKKKSNSRKKNLPVYFRPVQAGMVDNAGPVHVQESGQSDRHFMVGVNKIVQDVIRESAFTEKYKVNIKRNQKTGEVEKVEKQEKDSLEMFTEQIKKRQKEAKIKKQKRRQKQADENKPQISKTQKRNNKHNQKKELQSKNRIEDLVEVKHEHVTFGEVAHAPPTLVMPNKVDKSMNAPRPGSKDLLLKDVLNSKSNKMTVQHSSARKSSIQGKDLAEQKVNKKGKRKHLPVALRRQLDKQQSEIIKAYKDLKKQKYAKV